MADLTSRDTEFRSSEWTSNSRPWGRIFRPVLLAGLLLGPFAPSCDHI